MTTQAMTGRHVVTAVSTTAAWLSMAAVVTYQVLLAALLFIKPELSPSWQPISEYAIGRHGWVMVLAFFMSALSYGALVMALAPHARRFPARIGLAVLSVCAIGTVGAGVFVTDPVETPPDALTPTGSLHTVAAGSALALLPVAALLINLSLARSSQALRPARRALLWTAILPMLGLLGFLAVMAVVVPDNGRFGPGVNIGWPNRFLLLVYMAWLMTLAWQLTRRRSPDVRSPDLDRRAGGGRNGEAATGS